MKIGDMVQADFPKSPSRTGIVLDIFKNQSRQLWEAKVLWRNGEIKTIRLLGIEVISESR